MAEGRVRNDGGASLNLKTEYFITDQQGNTRISFEDNGSGVPITRQETSFYAFGMPIAGGYIGTAANKKLYNAGSEWQDDIEALADYYSTFYREYDPILGRFNGVDPKSENFESWTTYHYSYNNPVNFNDPMGDAAAATTASGKYFEQLLAELARDGINSSNAKYYPWEGSDGGGSPYVNDPFTEAISKLHERWGVTNSTFGGQSGFNSIVNRVKGQSGSKTDTESDEFYDLAAGETVREQVFNQNMEEALKTILKAYENVFEGVGNGYSMKYNIIACDGGFNTVANQTEKRIIIGFSQQYFNSFAFSKGKDFNTFGGLVRAIYHEYVHAWDMSGTKGTFISTFKKELLEFRGHFLMARGDVRLPQMSRKEQSIFWGAVLAYEDTYGRYYGDLFKTSIKNDNSISVSERNMYQNWYNQIIKYKP